MRNFLPFFLLFFISWTTTVHANLDSLKALDFRQQAIQYIEAKQVDRSLVFQKQTLTIFKKNDDLLNWLTTYRSLATVYTKIGEPFQALALIKEAHTKKWRLPKDKKEWTKYAWFFAYEGTIHYKFIGDFQQTIIAYDHASNIFIDTLKQEDFKVAKFIYTRLGNSYTRFGDYEKALYYLKKVRRISLEYGNYTKAAEAIGDIAIAYHAMKNYQAAITVLKEGLALNNMDRLSKSFLRTNLGLQYYETGNHKQALDQTLQAQVELSKAIQDFSNHKEVWRQTDIYSNLALIHQALGEYDKSRNSLQKSLDLSLKFYANPKRREIGKIHIALGKIDLQTGAYHQAMDHFQQAMHCVIPDFQNADFTTNPSIESLYAENTIMEALDAKAKAFVALFKQNRQEENIQHALKCMTLAFEVEDKLRVTFDYESSSLLELERSRKRIENAINLCHEAWSIHKNKQYLIQAFSLSERSQGLLLLEARKQTNATLLAELPDAILAQKRSLQQQIIFFEKQLFLKQQLSNNESAKEQEKLKDKIFQLKKDYRKLMDQLRKDFPKYNNSLAQSSQVSIQELQDDFLESDQALLEYFVGEADIFVFLIKKKEIHFIKIKKDFPLEHWIKKMREGIYNYQLDQAPSQALYLKQNKIYTAHAYLLYQKIIHPIKKNLPLRVLIVPDGVLGYLPFEVLLSEAPTQNHNFKSHAYFIKAHQISYTSSVSFLKQLQLKSQRPQKNKILAFAPLFKATAPLAIAARRKGLGALKYNISEVAILNHLMPTDAYIDQRATIAHFKQQAPNYQIIHLATHSKANDKSGDYSFLVFAKPTLKNEYDSLFVKDLSLMNLSADLIFLSACETGIGELQKGEGIIGFARGFTQAGAKSMITSLWSVDDHKTSILTQQFYQNLKLGMAKDQALRAAKLAYIDQHPHDEAHPFFWAAFIPIGDMSPLSSDSNSWYWLFIPALLLSFLFLQKYFLKK